MHHKEIPAQSPHLSLPSAVTKEIDVKKSKNDGCVVLVGITGSGKSTFGNFLLQNKQFAQGHSMFHSCTDELAEGTLEFQGKKLTVLDTPGLYDTRGALSDVRHLLALYRHIVDQNSEPISAIVLVSSHGSYDHNAIRFFTEFFNHAIGINTVMVITRADNFRIVNPNNSAQLTEQEVIDLYQKTYKDMLHCKELPIFTFDLRPDRCKKKEDMLIDSRDRELFLRLITSMPNLEKKSDIFITKTDAQLSAHKAELQNLCGEFSSIGGHIRGYMDGLGIESEAQDKYLQRILKNITDNTLIEEILALKSKLHEIDPKQLMLVKSQTYTKKDWVKKDKIWELEFKIASQLPFCQEDISVNKGKVSIKNLIRSEKTLSGTLVGTSAADLNVVISLLAKKSDIELENITKIKGQIAEKEALLRSHEENINLELKAYVSKWHDIASEKLKTDQELYKDDPKKLKQSEANYKIAIERANQTYDEIIKLIEIINLQKIELLQPTTSLQATNDFLAEALRKEELAANLKREEELAKQARIKEVAMQQAAAAALPVTLVVKPEDSKPKEPQVVLVRSPADAIVITTSPVSSSTSVSSRSSRLSSLASTFFRAAFNSIVSYATVPESDSPDSPSNKR